MVKFKKIDYSDIWWAIFWCILIVGLVFGGFASVYAGTDAWVINAEAGDVYDSITYEHYMGDSAAADTSILLCVSCSGYSDTVLVADSLYHFIYLYFWPAGDTNPGAWGFFKSPSDTTGNQSSIVFPLRAFWTDSSIASRVRSWTYNGITLISSTTTGTSFDSNYSYSFNDTINTSYFHVYTVDLSFPGVDSSLTWTFQVEPSNLGLGSGLDLPSSADLVNVYGWLRTIDGNPIKGAIIQATRRASQWGIGGSSPPVIVPQIVGWAQSDTLGLFQLILRRTGSYTDTTKGFYDIVGVHGTNQLFKIEKLYIPDVDSLSIADSLSGRE